MNNDIHNAPSINHIDNNFCLQSNSSKYKIAYVGILSESRFIKEIIEFVKSDDRFELHIGGYGLYESDIIRAAQECDRIRYYGKIPYSQTLSLEKNCDIITAIYDPSIPNHIFAAPNKFYEALMLGKPLIMVKNTGFDDILSKYNIGVLIEYNLDPEEFNRQAISIISQYNFCPTELSKQNLINEGKNPDTIHVTGNTAIDALKTTVRADYEHSELKWAEGSKLIIITAHRRENLGEPMHHMFRAIRRIMDEHPDVKAIYPIHMNPIVRQEAYEEFGDFDRIHIIEPLDVLDFHNFMARCYMILTDSGGVQEEAPSLGKPVLVMRDTTERPEGIAAGTLKLVGTDEKVIYDNFKILLEDKEIYNGMAQASNPYGDGFACKRIADILEI